MLKKVTIRLRLIVVTGVLVALLVGVGLIGVAGIGKANEAVYTVYQEQLMPTGQIAAIRNLLMQNRLLIATALVTPTPEIIKANTDAVERNIAEVTRLWETYMTNSLGADERRQADEFAGHRGRFVNEGLRPAIAALRAGDLAMARRLVEEKVRPLFEPVGSGVNSIMKHQLDGARDVYERAQSRYTLLRAFAFGAIGLGVLIAVVMATLLVRAIVRPLDAAVKVADAVAAGDLTSCIEATSQDELGRLMDALQRMNGKLVAIVGGVRSSADAISTGTQQIAAGNADLSQRTEEQASSLEETASSMEELTSTVKQNADNAKQANQLAAGASQVAVRGGEVVGQVVHTMTSINESSKKIVDIISVIDGIAFQTNILALNAAVEAARAGEQGRGFAVVASEVRSLAQRSAAAAKEIKELITDSVSKVENGTQLVDEAGKTMDEIVASVKRVTDIMAEISAASQEQSSGIEQVNQAVTQMDEVTQQNAALVEEAAAAAESLQEQAQNLTQAVAVFKLAHRSEAAASPSPACRPAATVTMLPRKRPATAQKGAEPSAARRVANGDARAGEEWTEF